MTDFVLASASPRRRELLANIGLDFTVAVSDADEDAVSKDVPVSLYVQELAMLKAASSAKRVLRNKRAVIIAADTVVTLDGMILGKPKDEEDAYDMLTRLSGRTHEVYTGICVMRISDAKTVCTSVRTEVRFRSLSEETVRAYIATGEPMDKAGAYGIQQKGALLVEGISGDYFNVVGLPVGALADLLRDELNIQII